MISLLAAEEGASLKTSSDSSSVVSERRARARGRAGRDPSALCAHGRAPDGRGGRGGTPSSSAEAPSDPKERPSFLFSRERKAASSVGPPLWRGTDADDA